MEDEGEGDGEGKRKRGRVRREYSITHYEHHLIRTHLSTPLCLPPSQSLHLY